MMRSICICCVWVLLFLPFRIFCDAPFAIFPCHYAGMFSCYGVALGMLDAYDSHEFSGMEVNFNGSGFYLDSPKGNNWWEYFFEPLSLGSKEGKESVCIEGTRIGEMWLRAYSKIPLTRCKELVDKYIKVRKEITDEVQAFVDKNFQSTYVIGIHFRGTDKPSERETNPTYEEVGATLEKFIQEKKLVHYKIFIATDEQQFLDIMKNQYGERVVCYEMKRSAAQSTPLHLDQTVSGYEKGKTALMDCLTLTRCNAFLGMESNLSAAVIWNNPTIPSCFVGGKYRDDERVALFKPGA